MLSYNVVNIYYARDTIVCELILNIILTGSQACVDGSQSFLDEQNGQPQSW